MRSNDFSMHVKQTIVRLQKQNKSIRVIAGTLEWPTGWYIRRKKEHTSELSNIKGPGRPRKTTVVDDRRKLSIVKKNPFTTFSQVKNTLQEVAVSLSKSTIKRRLHERKYRGFTTRCKQGQVRLCQKTHKTDHFWKSILWTAEIKKSIKAPKITLKKSTLVICACRWVHNAHTLCLLHTLMAWACMASGGTGLLVFSDDMTEDRSSRMNSEVYRDILSAQIQLNGAKLIGWRS